jgi:hypothetical protein
MMDHIPKIIIKTIDPGNQRFGESGDWFHDAEENTITVFISRMNDWRSEIAVAIHEAYEAVSCLASDVDQTDVDVFDKNFYLTHDSGEAGDDKDAPYFNQHKSATFIEQEVCSQLNLSWEKHSANCDDL